MVAAVSILRKRGGALNSTGRAKVGGEGGLNPSAKAQPRSGFLVKAVQNCPHFGPVSRLQGLGLGGLFD
jgi:hypothetical protein